MTLPLFSMKVGVVLMMTPEIERMITIVSNTLALAGLHLVITSGAEGLHRDGSLHYRFRAFDMRNNNWSDGQRKEIPEALKRKFAALNYPVDVVVERDHIHIEWDERA